MGMDVHIVKICQPTMYVDKPKHNRHEMFVPTLTKIFRIAQWFGIPSYGNKISLVWAIILLFMLVAIEVASLWKIVLTLTGIVNNDDDRGLTARLSGAIFYGNGLLSFILSWRFISSWKTLSTNWKRTEEVERLKKPLDGEIQKKVIIVTVFVAICALVEHLLSMVSAIGFYTPPWKFFQRYILISHGFLISPDQYNLWTAIPVFILSKVATILWNFQDLIIILVSMGLTARYHCLNSFVQHVVKYEHFARDKKEIGSNIYNRSKLWRRIREAYVRQASLVRLVDVDIGGLILLSNINNFYFICLQLFLGLNKTQGSISSYLYYFVSLGWLLLRACSVVLAAADVHVHSKLAIPYLQACSGSGYIIEIKRLINQLVNDCVALSGKKFFLLQRQTLLKVAGNILTYELVLIQYDK